MPLARVRGCLDACQFTTAKNCYSGPNEQLLCLAHDYLPIADISARHQLVRRPTRRRSLRSVGLKQFAPGAVALQFSKRDARIASTIAGVSKPERVAETLAWAQADIPEDVPEEIGALGNSSEDPEANRDC